MDVEDIMALTLRPHRIKIYKKNFKNMGFFLYFNTFFSYYLSLMAHSQMHMCRHAKSDVAILLTTLTH